MLWGQLSRRSKTEKTADICTVFVAVPDHLNSDTGKKEKGNVCMLCK